MKGRESGMPEEAYWNSFFDVEAALDVLLGPQGVSGHALEFGCGYGTFTLPAARRISGTLRALDIESALVADVQRKADAEGINNVQAELRDFVADGSGLQSASQAHAMIYNLLHLDHPVALLREAHRVLSPGATLSVIHWRSDIPTPRGPSLAIRPRPEQCEAWLSEAGFKAVRPIELGASCPYHFGLLAER